MTLRPPSVFRVLKIFGSARAAGFAFREVQRSSRVTTRSSDGVLILGDVEIWYRSLDSTSDVDRLRGSRFDLIEIDDSFDLYRSFGQGRTAFVDYVRNMLPHLIK